MGQGNSKVDIENILATVGGIFEKVKQISGIDEAMLKNISNQIVATRQVIVDMIVKFIQDNIVENKAVIDDIFKQLIDEGFVGVKEFSTMDDKMVKEMLMEVETVMKMVMDGLTNPELLRPAVAIYVTFLGLALDTIMGFVGMGALNSGNALNSGVLGAYDKFFTPMMNKYGKETIAKVFTYVFTEFILSDYVVNKIKTSLNEVIGKLLSSVQKTIVDMAKGVGDQYIKNALALVTGDITKVFSSADVSTMKVGSGYMGAYQRALSYYGGDDCGCSTYGTTGGFAISNYARYGSDAAAVAKDGLAADLADIVGELAGLSQDDIAKGLKYIASKIPTGSAFKSNAEGHGKMCKSIAMKINEKFGNEVVDSSLPPNLICQKVYELVGSLGTSVHEEFLYITTEIKQIVHNLHLVSTLLEKTFDEVSKHVKSEDEVSVINFGKLHKALIKELNHESNMIANMLKVSEDKAEQFRGVREITDKDSRELVERINRDVPGESAFGELINMLLNKMASTGQLMEKINKALKTVGKSMSEYKGFSNIKELEEKIMADYNNHKDVSMSDYIAAMNLLSKHLHEKLEVDGKGELRVSIMGGVTDGRTKHENYDRNVKALINMFNKQYAFSLEAVVKGFEKTVANMTELYKDSSEYELLKTAIIAIINEFDANFGVTNADPPVPQKSDRDVNFYLQDLIDPENTNYHTLFANKVSQLDQLSSKAGIKVDDYKAVLDKMVKLIDETRDAWKRLEDENRKIGGRDLYFEAQLFPIGNFRKINVRLQQIKKTLDVDVFLAEMSRNMKINQGFAGNFCKDYDLLTTKFIASKINEVNRDLELYETAQTSKDIREYYLKEKNLVGDDSLIRRMRHTITDLDKTAVVNTWGIELIATPSAQHATTWNTVMNTLDGGTAANAAHGVGSLVVSGPGLKLESLSKEVFHFFIDSDYLKLVDKGDNGTDRSRVAGGPDYVVSKTLSKSYLNHILQDNNTGMTLDNNGPVGGTAIANLSVGWVTTELNHARHQLHATQTIREYLSMHPSISLIDLYDIYIRKQVIQGYDTLITNLTTAATASPHMAMGGALALQWIQFTTNGSPPWDKFFDTKNAYSINLAGANELINKETLKLINDIYYGNLSIPAAIAYGPLDEYMTSRPAIVNFRTNANQTAVSVLVATYDDAVPFKYNTEVRTFAQQISEMIKTGWNTIQVLDEYLKLFTAHVRAHPESIFEIKTIFDNIKPGQTKAVPDNKAFALALNKNTSITSVVGDDTNGTYFSNYDILFLINAASKNYKDNSQLKVLVAVAMYLGNIHEGDDVLKHIHMSPTELYNNLAKLFAMNDFKGWISGTYMTATNNTAHMTKTSAPGVLEVFRMTTDILLPKVVDIWNKARVHALSYAVNSVELCDVFTFAMVGINHKMQIVFDMINHKLKMTYLTDNIRGHLFSESLNKYRMIFGGDDDFKFDENNLSDYINVPLMIQWYIDLFDLKADQIGLTIDLINNTTEGDFHKLLAVDNLTNFKDLFEIIMKNKLDTLNLDHLKKIMTRINLVVKQSNGLKCVDMLIQEVSGALSAQLLKTKVEREYNVEEYDTLPGDDTLFVYEQKSVRPTDKYTTDYAYEKTDKKSTINKIGQIWDISVVIKKLSQEAIKKIKHPLNWGQTRSVSDLLKSTKSMIKNVSSDHDKANIVYKIFTKYIVQDSLKDIKEIAFHEFIKTPLTAIKQMLYMLEEFRVGFIVRSAGIINSVGVNSGRGFEGAKLVGGGPVAINDTAYGGHPLNLATQCRISLSEIPMDLIGGIMEHVAATTAFGYYYKAEVNKDSKAIDSSATLYKKSAPGTTANAEMVRVNLRLELIYDRIDKLAAIVKSLAGRFDLEVMNGDKSIMLSEFLQKIQRQKLVSRYDKIASELWVPITQLGSTNIAAPSGLQRKLMTYAATLPTTDFIDKFIDKTSNAEYDKVVQGITNIVKDIGTEVQEVKQALDWETYINALILRITKRLAAGNYTTHALIHDVSDFGTVGGAASYAALAAVAPDDYQAVFNITDIEKIKAIIAKITPLSPWNPPNLTSNIYNGIIVNTIANNSILDSDARVLKTGAHTINAVNVADILEDLPTLVTIIKEYRENKSTMLKVKQTITTRITDFNQLTSYYKEQLKENIYVELKKAEMALLEFNMYQKMISFNDPTKLLVNPTFDAIKIQRLQTLLKSFVVEFGDNFKFGETYDGEIDNHKMMYGRDPYILPSILINDRVIAARSTLNYGDAQRILILPLLDLNKTYTLEQFGAFKTIGDKFNALIGPVNQISMSELQTLQTEYLQALKYISHINLTNFADNVQLAESITLTLDECKLRITSLEAHTAAFPLVKGVGTTEYDMLIKPALFFMSLSDIKNKIGSSDSGLEKEIVVPKNRENIHFKDYAEYVFYYINKVPFVLAALCKEVPLVYTYLYALNGASVSADKGTFTNTSAPINNIIHKFSSIITEFSTNYENYYSQRYPNVQQPKNSVLLMYKP